MKQGDVVLVPFPYTNLRAVKTRPALVISRRATKHGDVILLGITSRFSREAFKISSTDLTLGRLAVTSYVNCDKVVTLHASIVRKNVAHLRTTVVRRIVTKFTDQF